MRLTSFRAAARLVQQGFRGRTHPGAARRAPYRGVMARRPHRIAVLAVVGVTTLVGCTGQPASAPEPRDAPQTTASDPSAITSSSADPSRVPRAEERPATQPHQPSAPRPPVVSDGRPRRAWLAIPALGLRDLPVVPYRGTTDDGPGTAIQDRGVAASPHGPRGGVGPGGVGNYLITAHRTSSTAPFENLGSLRRGNRVIVRVGAVRHIYEVRRTRETSFRSVRSLAEQRAAIPGRLGVAPTRAYLTLSTCATPEDHAAGNYWADRFHNPEHRIDKIAVLVRTVRPASG
jgi:sortase A